MGNNGKNRQMNTCYLCRAKTVADLLDFGLQPVSNRFLAAPSHEEYSYPLAIGQCTACGLIQISDPVPAEELRPRFDWISYNEPENHLDELARIITTLPDVDRDSPVWGVSLKDDSLLERISALGFRHTYRLAPKEDLGIAGSGAGVETVQASLRPDMAGPIVRAHGRPRIIIARHIFEHSHDASGFMKTLKDIVGPGGYVLIEVPDCLPTLEHGNYSNLWEEHVLYFTPETFRSGFVLAGLSLVHFEIFPYTLENCIIGIGQVGEKASPFSPSPEIVRKEKARMRGYCGGFTKQRRRFDAFLSEHRKTRGNIALFGSGHLCCAFVNLLELKEHFTFVVDDNPKKQGLFMPGSRLPIRGSSALSEEDIKLCLLCSNPDNDDRIMQKHHGFTGRNGRFASIFSASKHALLPDHIA